MLIDYLFLLLKYLQIKIVITLFMIIINMVINIVITTTTAITTIIMIMIRLVSHAPSVPLEPLAGLQISSVLRGNNQLFNRLLILGIDS